MPIAVDSVQHGLRTAEATVLTGPGVDDRLRCRTGRRARFVAGGAMMLQLPIGQASGRVSCCRVVADHDGQGWLARTHLDVP